MRRWVTFIKERFPILSHLTMILLFVGSHFMAAFGTGIEIDPLRGLCLFVAILIFFFKMRLYDEIKDYELDLTINPNRPLPRGLVTLKEVKLAIGVSIVIEVFLFMFMGLWALATFVFAVLYSLLMYKEFFIAEKIRPHLTTYAMIHTIVTIPMGLSIFCGILNVPPWELPTSLLLFSICNWPLFNIFEFGRKTFATSEERNQVESYSKIFGRAGAVALVLVMACAAVVLICLIMPSQSYLQIKAGFLLLGLGATYVVQDSPKWAKIYRGISSFYIVLFYVFYLAESFAYQGN